LLFKVFENEYKYLAPKSDAPKTTEVKTIDTELRETQQISLTSVKHICQMLKHESTNGFILIDVMSRIREVGFGNLEIIQSLQEFISTSSFILRKLAVETLVEIDPYNIEAVDMLIDYLVNVNASDYLYFGLDPFIALKTIDILKREFYPRLISKIKLHFFENNSIKQANIQYFDCNSFYELYTYHAYENSCQVLWHCVQNMSYPDFYEAWHSQPIFIHPEIADTNPSNNTKAIQSLESQNIDFNAIQKELDRTNDRPEELRCIVVDIRQLEQENDPNAIAEEIGIRIFDTLGLEIPEIQRVSNLKRELTNLKHKLDVKKIAIALYSNSANEAIEQLCQSLAPIQTRLFTGGQTTQELITKINAWLSEM